MLDEASDRARAWRRAQAYEREFWAPVLTPRYVRHINEWGDLVNDGRHLDIVAPWVRRPFDTGVDLGCGPCGLLPFVDVRRRVGIDPLVDWFERKGIDYAKVGYATAIAGRMEDAYDLLVRNGVEPEGVNLICCCNALDHVADLGAALDGLCYLGASGTEAIIAYDVRHTATALHPSLTSIREVGCFLRGMSLEMADHASEPAMHDVCCIHGRRHELWVRR